MTSIFLELWQFLFRIVGGKEVNPKYRLPYQAFVYVSAIMIAIMMVYMIKSVI